MVAEAPMRLDGHVAWGEALHWHMEEGTHRLLAKQFALGEMLAVVCDHIGTPKEMFDKKGSLVWAADHHIWGAVRVARSYGSLDAAHEYKRLIEEHDCPWRFPGQYEDAESGLSYNRHRHYDPLTGQYASPDPIGLAGGARPQGYVANPAVWTDPLGLAAKTASRVSTAPDSAFFWSGRTEGLGGAEIAAKIAKGRGGTTLETLIEERGIKMPAWDEKNPIVVQAWKDISAEYASGASGTVRGVIGAELRPGNVWETAEIPALMANPNVTKIIAIDPKYMTETIVFKRK